MISSDVAMTGSEYFRGFSESTKNDYVKKVTNELSIIYKIINDNVLNGVESFYYYSDELYDKKNPFGCSVIRRLEVNVTEVDRCIHDNKKGLYIKC